MNAHAELLLMIGVRLGFASAASMAAPHRGYRERVIADIERLRSDYADRLTPEVDEVIAKYLTEFKQGRL